VGDEKKDEKSGGLALLDFELAMITQEANGASVARRAHSIKAKCPKCEHEATINVTEFTAGDAVMRLKSCAICRHEFREGSAKPVDPA
jgi:DNA-directed RNA polymerase subunit M/transcription elongation factor TFIIS